MELDFALLTENVDLSRSGTLHLFNAGFDSFILEKLPARRRFVVVVRLSLTPDEVGTRHKLRIDLIDPEGTHAADFYPPQTGDISKPATRENRPGWELYFVRVEFEFRQNGQYLLSINVDEKEVKKLKVFIDLPGVASTAKLKATGSSHD